MKVETVRRQSSMRPLWQRVVALTAAYAVALATLVASYGAARAAGAVAAQAGAVICHTVVADDSTPAPASDQTDHCADNCCIGCMTLLTALPPPPAKVIGAPVSASQTLLPPQVIVLIGGQKTKDYRSRAPPLAA
jgi:DUF2946 family protein